MDLVYIYFNLHECCSTASGTIALEEVVHALEFFFFLMNLAIATPFISDVIFNIAHFKEIEEHVK